MKRISVERYVQQVINGSHYKGYIKIAETKLDYEIIFAIPIDQLDNMEPGPVKNENEIRRLFQITVTHDDANIELAKEEFAFFLSMLAEFAVDFYHNPQTQDSNQGFFGRALRGEGPLADFGGTASIGITSSGLFNFPPEICEMLSLPKFGCAIA